MRQRKMSDQTVVKHSNAIMIALEQIEKNDGQVAMWQMAKLAGVTPAFYTAMCNIDLLTWEHLGKNKRKYTAKFTAKDVTETMVVKISREMDAIRDRQRKNTKPENGVEQPELALFDISNVSDQDLIAELTKRGFVGSLNKVNKFMVGE